MKPQYVYRVVILEEGMQTPILEGILHSYQKDNPASLRDFFYEAFSHFVHGYMDEKIGHKETQKFIDRHTITVTDYPSPRIFPEGKQAIERFFLNWLDEIL